MISFLHIHTTLATHLAQIASIDFPARMEQSVVSTAAAPCVANSRKIVSLRQPATRGLNLETWYIGEPQK